jgi:hypothetical protein
MYTNQDPKNDSGNNVRRTQRRGRNITSQSEVFPSNVYPMYPNGGGENSSTNKVEKHSWWGRLKSTVAGTFEYLERRPGLNFGLFAIAQLFAEAGLPSLLAIGGLVIVMTVTAAQVYNSREFVNQGLAICAGLGLARMIQIAVTILL